MNKAKATLLVILLSALSSITTAKEYGLHFDDTGKIIKPDQHYLWLGVKDEKAGFRDSAFKNFKLAAEYGNYHAMSLVALYFLQDKDYKSAHAWFKLIDLGKIPNREYMETMVKNLEIMLSPEALKTSNKDRAELSETYGSYPAMLRREEWRSRLKFTGTHIRGYIPPFLRINLNSGVSISGANVKKQVENFVYNYEFDFGVGEVVLDEIELIEYDEPEEEK